MPRARGLIAAFVVGLWISAASAARPADALAAETPERRPLLTGSVDPRQFGTEDYTITVLSGAQFFGSYYAYVDPATLSLRFSLCDPELAATRPDVAACAVVWHFYTSLDLPAGAVIDYIGVNSATTVDAALGFTLHRRDADNQRTTLATFSIPAHGFATDYVGPLGIVIPANVGHAYVLDLENSHPGLDVRDFGYVEIWWKRRVSTPPAVATFGDVPPSHGFYQFIEALAASGITAGCGGGNFCPDAKLTRGQMAVFLAKALGLHWSN